MVYVRSHHRAGHSVSGYNRSQVTNRGSFSKGKKHAVYRTMWKKDNRGYFTGRRDVAGYGDGTGVLRERKGRIIGRTPV